MQHVGWCDCWEQSAQHAEVEDVVLMADKDHRKRLEALRDRLEAALETCSENMLPQLAGQYRACLADLADLPSIQEASPADDLNARRASRLAAAKAAM
jgi:hypothetical protein